MRNGSLALLGVVLVACTASSKPADAPNNSQVCHAADGGGDGTAGVCTVNSTVHGADSGSADAGGADDAAPATDAGGANESMDAAISGDSGNSSMDSSTGTMTQADSGGVMHDAASGNPVHDASSGMDAQIDAGAVQTHDSGAMMTAGSGGSRHTDSGTDAGTDAASNVLCASCGGCEVSPPLPATVIHTDDPVSYPDPPPTSGNHNECWATWGVHDTPTPPERWVHNLEHGGIVYLYNCPLGCASDVDQLKQLVGAHQRTVLTEYDQMSKKFAIVAWGHRIVTDCVDVTAFNAFYTEHFDKAPESNGDQPSDGCPP